jgi:hypothetical protein
MPRIVRVHDVGGPEVLRLDELEVELPGATPPCFQFCPCGTVRGPMNLSTSASIASWISCRDQRAGFIRACTEMPCI